MTCEDYRANTGLSSGNFTAVIAGASAEGYCPGVAGVIAANLRKLRAKRRVSQSAVARALGQKNSVSVNRWEAGTRIPTADSLEKLARFYGVAPGAIDPDNEAWDPETPRPRETLKSAATSADGHVTAANQGLSEEEFRRAMSERIKRDARLRQLVANFDVLESEVQDRVLLDVLHLATDQQSTNQPSGGSHTARKRKNK